MARDGCHLALQCWLPARPVAAASAPPLTMVRWPPQERMQARPVGPCFTATWPTSTPARFMEEMNRVPHCGGRAGQGRCKQSRSRTCKAAAAGLRQQSRAAQDKRPRCKVGWGKDGSVSLWGDTHLVKAPHAQQLRGHAKARQTPCCVGSTAACNA